MYNLLASQVAKEPIYLNKGSFRSRLGIGALIVVGLILTSGCTPGETTPLTDDVSKVSYGMGYSLGENVKSQGADVVNYEAYLLGVKESLGGLDSQISEEELKVAVEAVQATRVEKQNQEKERIMQEGLKFLAEVAARENVVTLESGMLYEIMVEGDGAKPVASDKVRTHYHGTLMDGTVFDSSVERGQPATFPVSGVIRGWVEALQLMSVGSKWRLYIPPELAYGERGAGGMIGPGATLVFEVELLEIVTTE